MTTLQSFTMWLQGAQITHQGIGEFSKGLKVILKDVKTFSLCLQQKDVAIKSIEMLVDLFDVPLLPKLLQFKLYYDVPTNHRIRSQMQTIEEALSLRNKEENDK